MSATLQEALRLASQDALPAVEPFPVAGLPHILVTDVNARDPYNDTALMQATYYGHTRTVALLIHHQANVNTQDDRCRSALSLAIAHKSGVLVEMLTKAGAK